MDEDLPYKDTLVMYCSAEDYIKEGKYAEAVPLLEEVLRLYPGWDYGDGYCHLGSCLWELKDESRALSCYRKAIEYMPEGTSFHYNHVLLAAETDDEIADAEYALNALKSYLKSNPGTTKEAYLSQREGNRNILNGVSKKLGISEEELLYRLEVEFPKVREVMLT